MYDYVRVYVYTCLRMYILIMLLFAFYEIRIMPTLYTHALHKHMQVLYIDARQLESFSRCSKDIITLLKSSSMAMCRTYFGQKLHASPCRVWQRGEHLPQAPSICAAALKTLAAQRVLKALLGPALHAGYAGTNFTGFSFRVESCSQIIPLSVKGA